MACSRHWRAAALFALLAIARSLCAHDSPEHEIEVLSAKMELAGTSAELLARRATEWRSLGKLKEAADDLRRAVALNGGSVVMLSELARVEAARGEHSLAQAAIEKAQSLSNGSERGAIHMLRAEILESKGDLISALAESERAFAGEMPAADWYLTRARLQSRAGKWPECAAGLQEGFEKTASVVLEIEWIEALIDAGEFATALKRIEPYAQRGKWKSAWFIRQARAQIGIGENEKARRNLEAALQELARRIDAARPEISLIAERGLARALLGDRALAASDLAFLRRNAGAFSGSVDRLERVLQQAGSGKDK